MTIASRPHRTPAPESDNGAGYVLGMARYVGLLRGINVGGNKRIKMADLKTALSGAGILNPTTLLQSGNAVFSSNARTNAVVDIVETTIESAFGFHCDVIVRTSAEFDAVTSHHPFSAHQLDDPRMAHVMFFKSKPPGDKFDELRATHEGPEEMTLIEQELCLYYPDGSGRSRLSGSLIEKALGVSGTARNWNTVMRIDRALKG
jgi:uncharacterized protein (DUF1697 family)